MHKLISKYLLYYPSTLLSGELIHKNLVFSRNFQWRDASNIEQYQNEQLIKILNFARKKSYFYNTLYKDINWNSINTLSDLSKLPIIDKDCIVNNSDTLKTGDNIFYRRKTTGGSTGRAVTIIKNPNALARERAVTARSYEWAGIYIGDKQVRFWGTPIENINNYKYKIIDLIANRKRISAFAISENDMIRYVTIINRFKPKYIYGYVSVISELANFYCANSLKLPRTVQSLITTSEVLTPSIRNNIQGSLGTRIFNEYGCGEVGSIAHECEHGSMHIMSDNLIVECIDQDGRPSSEGEIVVTDLYNYAMPLIRYKLGDYASLNINDCKCGRKLPIISGIHGRAYDMLILKSGKKIHPEAAMYIFEEVKDKFNAINQFQVIQESYERFLIRIIKGTNYDSNIEKYIRDRFHQQICFTCEIIFEYTNSIERERSGKLRLIKSQIRA